MDYIGIAQNLKSALSQYSRDDQKHAGIDEAEAVAVMLEKYEIVSDIFHGFDYRAGLLGTPQKRLAALAGAMEWVLDIQQREATRCLIPWFDGAILSQEWKEALWDKFVTAAPRPRTPSEQQ